MCLLFPPQTVSRRATTRLGVWREMCVNVVRDLWDTDVAPVSHGFSLVRYLCLKIIICREYLGSVFENIQCVHKYSSDSKHLLQTNRLEIFAFFFLLLLLLLMRGVCITFGYFTVNEKFNTWNFQNTKKKNVNLKRNHTF